MAFCPREWEFEHKFAKIQVLERLPGGMLKLLFIFQVHT